MGQSGCVKKLLKGVTLEKYINIYGTYYVDDSNTTITNINSWSNSDLHW